MTPLADIWYHGSAMTRTARSLPPSYAQFGEDRILHRYLPDGCGIYVEVGGNDGVTASNTLFFEQLGRRCVVVEPIPGLAARIRRGRTCTVIEAAVDECDGEAEFLIATGGNTLSTLNNRNRVRSRIDEHSGDIESVRVVTRTLDSILCEVGAGEIDLISIDVEGNELSVLRGLTLWHWKPRVLILEDNSFGRDAAVQQHLAARGYVRFRITGVNHWYCHADDRRLNTALRRAFSCAYALLVRAYAAISGRGRARREQERDNKKEERA
ncbi:MAG: FkbM family methyltransferase [Spirochaetaceae bacterium]|nr:MAG: FkbM family methyltransferase [Spirochaetaceae bacterium]